MEGAPFSETVAREVEVLRVEASDVDVSAPATIFVLAAPETAERLAAATAFSQLSIAVVSSASP